MKLLAILFSFYILLLPALPCSDKTECNTNNTSATLQVADHGQHQHQDEGCSPFCNCACCGQIFTPSFQLAKTVVVKPIPKKQSSFYKNEALPSSFLDNIWQPPRCS